MAERAVPQPYRGYNVLEKWSSPSFDAVTRTVVARRLQRTPPRRFFAADAFRTLEAACARLLATEPAQPPIASWIDADLFEGRGEGFRHDDMARADVVWRNGLAGIDAEARRRFGAAFADLGGDAQDATLRAVQAGDVDAAGFHGVPARRFFVQVLLKAAAGHFYGSPQGWNEIGFGGPASPRGYVRLRLDRRDPWEAPFRSDRGASR